jgi:hypothetical protein
MQIWLFYLTPVDFGRLFRGRQRTAFVAAAAEKAAPDWSEPLTLPATDSFRLWDTLHGVSFNRLLRNTASVGS